MTKRGNRASRTKQDRKTSHMFEQLTAQRIAPHHRVEPFLAIECGLQRDTFAPRTIHRAQLAFPPTHRGLERGLHRSPKEIPPQLPHAFEVLRPPGLDLKSLLTQTVWR